jgi:hypothetical protein
MLDYFVILDTCVSLEPISYRKRQLSQWDFVPTNAFVVYRQVNTGLSSATCCFIFYERDTGNLIKDDCLPALKRHLTEVEPSLP